MALIIEDGTIVSSANSYITEAEANSILAAFGFPALIPLNAESQLIQAAQYLESFRKRYKGQTEVVSQSLCWPRAGVVVDCFELPFDEIPNQLKRAQAIAAGYLASEKSLYSDSCGQEILSKKVDVISVTYSDSGIANSQNSFGLIDAQLSVLLKPLTLSTLRV